MNLPARLSIAAVCLAAVTLAAGAVLGGQILLAVPGILLAAGWLIAWLVFDRPYSDFMLVLFMATAVVELVAGISPLWMTIGALCALAAWDLERFSHWIASASRVDSGTRLARDHFMRLLSVLVLGALLCIAVQQIRFSLPFWLLILLGAVLAFSLNRALILLDRRGK